MLICYHVHQTVTYATWAQTNNQIILFILSLNEEETEEKNIKALHKMRNRCEVGICVNQRRVAASGAKSHGGDTHHPMGEPLSQPSVQLGGINH